MKDQILAELKKKYTGQLTSKFMGSLAERLAEKVEKEEDIEGAVSELESSVVKIGDIQTEGDRRVSELTARIKEYEGKLKELEDKPPAAQTSQDKEDISNLEGMIKSLQNKFDQKEKEALRDKARATLLERVADKRIPKVLLDKVDVNSPDEVDEAIEKLEEDHKALRKEMGLDLAQDPPRRGDPQAASAKQIIDDIKKFKVT